MESLLEASRECERKAIEGSQYSNDITDFIEHLKGVRSLLQSVDERRTLSKQIWRLIKERAVVRLDELTAWQIEKRRGYGKKQRQMNVPTRTASRLQKNGRPLTSSEERQEVESLYTELLAYPEETMPSWLLVEYSSGKRHLELPQLILSEGLVRKAIHELNTNSASAQDGITAGMLKALGDLGVGLLARIFEGALNGDAISWGEVLISLLPKVDQPNLAKDFRPISVLPFFFKTCEKIVLGITKESTPSFYSGLPNYHLGFRPGCQAEENVSALR
jgi:hypothetical protein